MRQRTFFCIIISGQEIVNSKETKKKRKEKEEKRKEKKKKQKKKKDARLHWGTYSIRSTKKGTIALFGEGEGKSKLLGVNFWRFNIHNQHRYPSIFVLLKRIASLPFHSLPYLFTTITKLGIIKKTFDHRQFKIKFERTTTAL